MSKTWPSAKKIAAFIGYAIAIAFVAITMTYLFNASKTGNIVAKGGKTSIMGYEPVIVITGSMVPAVAINSISILKYCTIDDLKVGDIVMYRYNNMRITHRVIFMGTDKDGKTMIVTKGDANQSQDQIEITASMVDGKLIKTYNGVAPLVSHFMITPGEINSAAISQGILFLIVFVSIAGVVLFNVGNMIHAIIIIVTNRNQYKQCLKDYTTMQELCLKYEEEVREILNNDDRSILSLMIKAKTIKGINELRETMKDFEKRLRFIRWLHKIFYTHKK